MNVINEFSVDQRFIDEGECDNPQRCAVALAGQFHLDCDVTVEASWMMVDGVVYRMTRWLREWVRDFDVNRGVAKPIRVILYEEENILMADTAEEDEDE